MGLRIKRCCATWLLYKTDVRNTVLTILFPMRCLNFSEEIASNRRMQIKKQDKACAQTFL